MTQLQALALSLATEVPLVLLMGLGWRLNLRRLGVVAACATLLTHPFAWWSFHFLHPHLPSFPLRAVLIEGAVAGTETALFMILLPLPPRRALTLGVTANAFSFAVGIAVS